MLIISLYHIYIYIYIYIYVITSDAIELRTSNFELLLKKCRTVTDTQ